jgi:hypothetical protein
MEINRYKEKVVEVVNPLVFILIKRRGYGKYGKKGTIPTKSPCKAGVNYPKPGLG